MRAGVCKARMRAKLARRRRAFNLINRVGRGFLCRRRVRRRKRQVEEAWALVGPMPPERRRDLERLLPKAHYPLVKEGEESLSTWATPDDVTQATGTTGTSWKGLGRRRILCSRVRTSAALARIV